MLKKVAAFLMTAAGIFIGYGFGVLLFKAGVEFKMFNVTDNNFWNQVTISILTAIIFGFIFFMISSRIFSGLFHFTKSMESELERIPAWKMVSGTTGLILGFLIAYLISPILKIIPIPTVSIGFTVMVYVILGYLGVSLATKNAGDVSKITELFKKAVPKEKSKASGAKPKILDTSVIIDGRIADILRTGFIEGCVVIPEFVLEELRHIADSSDSLKRNRGRRGLDILKIIQQELKVDIKISDVNFEDTEEVDIKLLKLAKKMDGMVVTNDYNLNKVAELQSVPVLNINELANAVKPVVLPGEEMTVTLVKEGKENNQGVAYLDDGTMIVVEGGKKHMNETIDVLVTSVLQTAAGRMIFAKPQ